MRPTERDTGAVWRLLSAWAADEQAKDRLHRKITQGDMARMFGVSSQTISTWKRCQARMPMDSQLRVIRATEISLDDLTAALAEDEPRIAEYVAARREEEGGGAHASDSGRAAAKTEPAPSPADQLGTARDLPSAASKIAEPSVTKRRRKQDAAIQENQDTGSFDPS